MTKNILTITLIGGGLIAGYSYYVKMRKTSAELEVVPEANIHAVNWDGIIIRLDLLLKNPTKGSFSIKFPFVKLTYKGTTVGSSQVVNQDIKIPAYGQAKIEKLLVSIPILSIFSVSTSILKAIQNKEQVMITATMKTTIDLGMVTVPFEENHEVILKK
ncbi:MAG: hypothetical protein J0H92_21155 [Sphingobacteriales bacterium]|nr:hypothetical protein [Sphingobacteriales bacterium]OJW31513.1 MAG: hypothetical protein BGO54_13705 [Sphingobacteriales bacterium 46-32]